MVGTYDFQITCKLRTLLKMVQNLGRASLQAYLQSELTLWGVPGLCLYRQMPMCILKNGDMVL